MSRALHLNVFEQPVTRHPTRLQNGRRVENHFFNNLFKGIPMIKHTFLFKEHTWIATGVYFDANNDPIPAAGETRIIHREHIWIIEGIMRVFGNRPQEIKNSYEIVPFGENRVVTRWTSFNPALGTLSGSFMIVDDAIISTYCSETGEYAGTECLLHIDEGCYHVRGFALKGDEKLSSWSFELKRKEHA